MHKNAVLNLHAIPAFDFHRDFKLLLSDGGQGETPHPPEMENKYV